MDNEYKGLTPEQTEPVTPAAPEAPSFEAPGSGFASEAPSFEPGQNANQQWQQAQAPSFEAKSPYVEQGQQAYQQPQQGDLPPYAQGYGQQGFNQQGFNQQGNAQQFYGYGQESDADRKGRTAFTLGIISLIAWLLPIAGYIVGIVGLTFASKGMQGANADKAAKGRLFCIIGLGLSVINSVLGIYLQTR